MKRIGMHFRMCSDADLEIRDALQARHQFCCARYAVWMRNKMTLVFRRIAAQGHDVAHARLPVAARNGSRSRSWLAPTQVRCAAGRKPSCCSMATTVSWVRSRVEPPAPYVTDTKRGDRGARRFRACHNFCSISGVLGGKNSKDTAGRFGDAWRSQRVESGFIACSRRFSSERAAVLHHHVRRPATSCHLNGDPYSHLKNTYPLPKGANTRTQKNPLSFC